MKKRKTNPRRIPLAKREIDSNAILEEATKDDMYRAWLLVDNAILDLELLPPSELTKLTDAVNAFIAASADEKQKAADMRRAEQMIAVKKPYGVLDPSYIRSEAELQAFKKKVYKLATFTALCVIYLGLESSGRIITSDLRRVFVNVDIAWAEIDLGLNSYEKLEKTLGKALLTNAANETAASDALDTAEGKRASTPGKPAKREE